MTLEKLLKTLSARAKRPSNLELPLVAVQLRPLSSLLKASLDSDFVPFLIQLEARNGTFVFAGRAASCTAQDGFLLVTKLVTRRMVTTGYFGALTPRADLLMSRKGTGVKAPERERAPLGHLVNSRYQLASYLLWIAHPVLQATVAGFMLRRKIHRTFPFFFAYLLAQMVSFAVVFPIYVSRSYFAFFYTYWTSAAIGVVLGFKVIHEVFVDIFRPYHTLKDLGSVLFKWSGLVMVLVAAVVSASTPATPQGPIVQGIMTLQRSVRVVQCGLVLFLLVFSSYLGICWRQRSFGIAVGFGVFASVELGLGALNMSGLVRFTPLTVGLLNMIAYNSAIVVWVVYAVINSPAREISANLLRSQRWERSLTDLQNPVPADSLIPMFEGMVDRAFSKTSQYSIEHNPAQQNEMVTTSASEYSGEVKVTPLLTTLSRSG